MGVALLIGGAVAAAFTLGLIVGALACAAGEKE